MCPETAGKAKTICAKLLCDVNRHPSVDTPEQRKLLAANVGAFIETAQWSDVVQLLRGWDHE